MPRAVPTLSRRLLHLAVVLSLAAAASPVAARQRATLALDPRTDVSPSGAYSLRVEPGSPEGRGAAHYRLEHAGQEVWAAELPFTLWESVVADDGTVAGYAYGNGLDGWSGVRGDHGSGDLRVVILDPAGASRLDLSTDRAMSRFPDSLPPPVAAGLLLDPDNDRVVIRVQDEDLNRQREEWWPFRLSTGEALAKFRPREHLDDPDPAHWIIRARHVQQTPLALLHWWTAQDSAGSDGWSLGARFTLMDLDGVPVWTLDLPTDYTLPGDEKAERLLREKVIRSGAILECKAPGRFDIGLVAAGQRVSFEATPDATAKHGWKVVEVGRSGWSIESPPETHPDTAPDTLAAGAVTEGRLQQVGSLELGGAATGPSFGWIRDFDLDDHGRFGLVREEEGKRRAFLLVSPAGLVLAELPLDLGPLGENIVIAAEWIAGGRWLLYVRWPSGGSNENPAWWLDVQTQRVEPVADLRLPEIQSIDGDGQGGFVALASRQLQYSIDELIVAIDATGRTRWTLAAGSEDETKPLSPEAVAVAPDGRVGVLDNTRQRVLVYAPDGSHVATIDLAKSWGSEPNYPTGLAADATGWTVHDFNGDVPLVRMSPAGEVTARIAPTFPDGRKLDPIGRVVAAPDGGLWTTDGHALLHVNEQGLVDRIAGSAPDPDRIDSVSAVVVDPQGRILVGDARTGAVHVFDAQGNKLFACRPSPEDEQGCEQLAGAPDGRIFAGGEKGFLCFSSSGERTGTAGTVLDFSDECWLFQPHGGKRWVVGYPGLVLADASGKVERRIEKRPDGTWLEHPDEAAVAPDGSVAVMCGSLCLYAPDGEPRQQFTLPEGTAYARVAFDGKRVLLSASEALFALDTGTGAWKRYPYASKSHGLGAIFFAPDGGKIRLVPFRSAQVLEFQLAD